MIVPQELRAEDSIIEDRKEKCKNCDHNVLNICTVCKCFIPFKVQMRDTSCPKGYW